MAKSLKKDCDVIWTEIIKARAHYISEVSGKEGRQVGGIHILHAHHIARKPNYALRYSLENGICLTAWEHVYGIHGNHEEEYRQLIIEAKGMKRPSAEMPRVNIYQQLLPLRNIVKADLGLIKLYLEKELAKYE